MTAFYPAFLDLRRRRCIVIGGNAQAAHRVIYLRETGAHAVVVSASVTEVLRELARHNSIEWIRRGYRKGDLKGAFLAITSSDVSSVNSEVWEEAEEEKVLLNAMDDAAHCHFIAPAIHREGDITVAVSTAGKGPALAVRLRDWIAQAIGSEHAALLDLLGELRAEVRRRLPNFEVRKDLWYRMVDSEAIEHLREGDVAAARGHLLGILSAASAKHERIAGEAVTPSAINSAREATDV
ncbi:MAG: bifunctional precorrin-2 dehydrogenase/sirohydrochlorin ferrochelatase [Gemmatimonadales bacterium]